MDRRMDCYLEAYTVCAPAPGHATRDDGCLKTVLSSCDRDFRCPGDAIDQPAPRLNPGYQIHPRVQYNDNCRPYRAELEEQVRVAVGRLQDCLNYAFVREDLAKRMVMVLEAPLAVRVRCDEPPSATWCAAAGEGEIWLSPSRMLAPGSFCHPELGMYFIHEVAHLAGFHAAAEHNELGETGEPDEVYSLQNYCMRPARMWLQRARRTIDVVDHDRLECLRTYQEFTPSTLRDPFWDEYRPRLDRGEDPCPASQDPALAPKPGPGRRGD